MQQSYNNCINKLEQFKNKLLVENDIKRGKLYFDWIKDKTQKILNERNEEYVYKNVLEYTLKKYKVDQYTYERLNNNLKSIVNRNYILKNNNYVFFNNDISKEETMLIIKNILFKRGNVVWIDFGFNIGNEFGGMHPAIILKNFDTELFVLPVSSKKPKEYIKIEQDYDNGKITIEECKKQKSQITEIVQLDNIYRFKDMTRWANITRIRKISVLRLNFTGTIGKVSGEYMNTISSKISSEF